MRKNKIQNIVFDTSRPINSAHEEAVFISTDADYPIRDILIGKTYPYSEYEVNLGATSKYYIFEYVIDGKGKILLDGEWHNLSAGDAYIVHKNTVRNYRSDPKCPLEKIWVSFSSDYVDSMLANCGLNAGVYHADVSNLFEEIMKVPYEEIEVREKVFKVANAINGIIMEIAKTCRFGVDEFSKIKNSVLTMLYEKSSLGEIASKFFMSKSNLIRIFKKYTGTTPYRFLLDEKIRVSKVLLKSTNMSVRMIAEQLCFTDEHYFSYVFKEKTGKSPLKYRNSGK